MAKSSSRRQLLGAHISGVATAAHKASFGLLVGSAHLALANRGAAGKAVALVVAIVAKSFAVADFVAQFRVLCPRFDVMRVQPSSALPTISTGVVITSVNSHPPFFESIPGLLRFALSFVAVVIRMCFTFLEVLRRTPSIAGRALFNRYPPTRPPFRVCMKCLHSLLRLPEFLRPEIPKLLLAGSGQFQGFAFLQTGRFAVTGCAPSDVAGQQVELLAANQAVKGDPWRPATCVTASLRAKASVAVFWLFKNGQAILVGTGDGFHGRSLTV